MGGRTNKKLIGVYLTVCLLGVIGWHWHFYELATNYSSSANIIDNYNTRDTQPLERKLNFSIYSRPLGDKSNGSSAGQLYIEDIFIAIKTTKKYIAERVSLLNATWIPQAASSVYFMTDDDKKDPVYSKSITEHPQFIGTNCKISHDWPDLLCKLQATYEAYMSKIERYKWWCTMDDDTYVIVPNLVKLLRNYNPDKDWYIGKPSLPHKYRVKLQATGEKIDYWFATGGSGICISRSLARRMSPLCSGDGMTKRGKEIRNPDDTTLGYIINYLLHVNLTVIPELHSHLEPLWVLNPQRFHDQITLSWGEAKTELVVSVKNRIFIRDEIPHFPMSVDDTRMFSIHCYLFPTSEQCLAIKKMLGDPSIRHP